MRGLVALALCAAVFASSVSGQSRDVTERYDPVFRKYSKRFFGVGFDWRLFKAQGMAESNLREGATSRVGARGIMQLMPTTFAEIQTKNPELESIDDPEWNIAAGIQYNRFLYRLWREHRDRDERIRFMFGSYNAGRVPILRAQDTAKTRELDHLLWRSIVKVAHLVPRWRHGETLHYVRKIERYHVELTGQRGPGRTASH